MNNLEFQHLLPPDFSPESRVWIYQSDRKLHANEEVEADKMLQNFIKNWKSHSQKVKGFGIILFHQFFILIADETEAGVSGCSTDSSVHIMKDIESLLNLHLFDRQLLAFQTASAIETIHLSNIHEAISDKKIHPDTLYFNNTVQNLRELKEKWIIPLIQSWLAPRLSFKSAAEC